MRQRSLEHFALNREGNIMTQYARLWVLKSDKQANAGDTIEVSLRSGKIKFVQIANVLGKDGDKFLYLPAGKQEAA
jgi:hypothetical protein